MKKPETISRSSNHTAVNIGPLENLSDYTLVHPKTGAELHKVFLKDFIGCTGSEISFQTLEPGAELPYFHTHRKNEETYVILRGHGKFQVDDVCFPISEGSVIRVAPEGKRSMANGSGSSMVYMVIQCRAGSLEEYSAQDGALAECGRMWY